VEIFQIDTCGQEFKSHEVVAKDIEDALRELAKKAKMGFKEYKEMYGPFKVRCNGKVPASFD